MITEDYVSYELAKLLKEKGFDEPIQYFYKYDSKELYRGTVFTNTQIGDKFYNAPTHQMAMKWLRKVHKLHIAILWDCGICIGKNSFYYHIDRMDNYEDKGYNKIGFDSYEQAVEAALKYTLENLI